MVAYRSRRLCFLVTLFYLATTQAVILEKTFNDTVALVATLQQRIAELQSNLGDLAKQTQLQQLEVEERVRSEGNSGIKQVRYVAHGTSSYFDYTHANLGVAAIHDHTNYHDTLGMGEVIVVINGVEFRTRHNDYRLVQPDTSTRTFRAVKDIIPPPVPPQVSSKPTVALQILEMREWFKAFKTQNITHRDYRPYFQPVICYMEGFWSLEQNIMEPFKSDRHALFASSWKQLQEQIFYTSYTGTKDLLENMAYLPTTIVSVNSITGKPVYAQWNYRILCNPIDVEVPLKYFRVQDDLASRTRLRQSYQNVNNTRAGRFRLSEYDYERVTGFTLLDRIMQDIPGLDNNPSMLNEVAFGMGVYNTAFNNFTKLNTGYYHRSYKTGTANAMGLSMVDRGFSDEMLFVAENTQPQIPAFDFTICVFRGPCTTRSSRFSYAIPLEIVYMTPLLTWNPYNLAIYPDFKTPPANGRTGSTTDVTKAFNGSSPIAYYYLTPKEFYSSTTGQPDPADTAIATVGVLDKTGVIRNVTASGVQIFTLPIAGLGTVRLRYPIPPIHGEGSTVWKDLAIVKNTIRVMQGAGSAGVPAYQMQLYPATVGGLHSHDFTVFKQDYDLIMNGETVSVSTSLANGHQHNLELWKNPGTNVLEYKTCDYQNVCFDQHPKNIKLVSSPGR
ncbi:uncharacterized protein LOC106058647 [Biomphalaria glabrata]|uniref:Uncharacterized protein LOC106058647 n=1 Tax=Biomphalaria glabrata TaxID=6526 RepID=A0A9W2ZC34_BIOGL|nr:uncharacterized protein LOC106058647 [Biomphalaria glabrata]XP_055872524.1 uncharacterized protein LOC106058647 [Biomphalaria glabrata]